MDRIKIRNNFDGLIEYPFGDNAGLTDSIKQITIPIKIDFNPMDYSDLLDGLIKEEQEKNINLIEDRETIKFNNDNLTLEFNFYDGNGFTSSYFSAGFTNEEVQKKRNAFTRSFFRLDFFDSNIEQEQNLIYSEFLSVRDTTEPVFPLNRLYWFKNDNVFLEGGNRQVYFSVRFFNAKTGVITRFLNGPITTPITIQQYSTNPSWRFAGINFVNPNANKDRLFFSLPINGNIGSTISFKELKVV